MKVFSAISRQSMNQTSLDSDTAGKSSAIFQTSSSSLHRCRLFDNPFLYSSRLISGLKNVFGSSQRAPELIEPDFTLIDSGI